MTKLHVLATFRDKSALLEAMRLAAGWIQLDEETVLRVLSPATHVYLNHGDIRRIYDLTLDEARQVIIRLCDDLEQARGKPEADDGGVRPGV